jgi:hypothetical protein
MTTESATPPAGTPAPNAMNTPPMAGGVDQAAIDAKALTDAAAAKVITDKAAVDAAAAKPPEKTPAAPQIDQSVKDQVKSMITEAGLDPEEVNRIVAGDGMTPAILKALTDKHGAGIAGLIQAQLTTIIDAAKSQASANDQTVFDIVKEQFKDITDQTGSETWKELSTWAKENVESVDRAEINKLLNQGGMAAKLAVQELITLFKGSTTYTQDAQLLSGDGLQDGGSAQPLDKRAYDSQMRELMNKGHVYGESQEMANLDKRRLKAIARGQ